jgi:hypothetical protein
MQEIDRDRGRDVYKDICNKELAHMVMEESKSPRSAGCVSKQGIQENR